MPDLAGCRKPLPRTANVCTKNGEKIKKKNKNKIYTDPACGLSSNGDLSIAEIGEKINAKECVSNFRNWNFIDGGTITGHKTGCTVNLGARESKCSMVFYEKNYEQSRKAGLPLENFGAWNRYEVRLRKEQATNCVKKIIEKENICFIGLEIINYYIRLVVKNETDQNRARWQTWQPWEQLIEGMGKLKLSMSPAPRTLEQKKHWVKNYVAPTLKMIQIADDNTGEEFFKNLMDETTLKNNHKSGTGSTIGWGKLKSGAGWISLEHCTKV